MDVVSRNKIDKIKEKMWKDSVKHVKKNSCKKCGGVRVNSYAMAMFVSRYGLSKVRCKC